MNIQIFSIEINFAQTSKYNMWQARMMYFQVKSAELDRENPYAYGAICHDRNYDPTN